MLRALVAPDMDDVAIPGGGDHSGHRAVIFENRVGADRRAVQRMVDRRARYVRACTQLDDPGDDLVGIELETARPVTVHVDYRPFAEFWQAWHDAGFPQPIEYDAEGCTLRLDLLPEPNGQAYHG